MKEMLNVNLCELQTSTMSKEASATSPFLAHPIYRRDRVREGSAGTVPRAQRGGAYSL